MQPITIATVVEETTTFSIKEICAHCSIPHELLAQMMEHGLIDFSNQLDESYQINIKTLKRIETAFHLHRDLEINMPGIALILELKEELEKLHKEVGMLNNYLSK